MYAWTVSMLMWLLAADPTSVDVALAKERRERVLLEGRPLYLRYCATCHGKSGDGKGPSAQFLDFPPRNFLSGNYEFRSSPPGTLPSEEDVFRTISVGVLGTPMPAWERVLTVRQRQLLTRYVLALSPQYGIDVPGPALVIPPEPPNTPESVTRGRAVFEQMGCTACHGDSGEGNGAAAAFLVDNEGHPIRPANLTKGIFQGGRGGEVIYRTVSTGLPGTPMPAFGDIIPADSRWDLVHYVQSLAKKRTFLQVLFDDPAGRIQVP